MFTYVQLCQCICSVTSFTSYLHATFLRTSPIIIDSVFNSVCLIKSGTEVANFEFATSCNMALFGAASLNISSSALVGFLVEVTIRFQFCGKSTCYKSQIVGNWSQPGIVKLYLSAWNSIRLRYGMWFQSRSRKREALENMKVLRSFPLIEWVKG